jgi:uncharacterized protein (DUF433 family)
MTAVMTERRKARAGLSPREAAFVTGLSEKTINPAIDRAEVRAVPARREEDRERTLGFPDLVYLRLRSEIGALLSAEGKRLLREQLMAPADPEGIVSIGPMEVRIAEQVQRVEERVAQIELARSFVVSDPEVRAGEPTVRGTRIPVYVLAELTAQGAGTRELLEDYPALTAESLEAALLFADMYPRRGRPRSTPWKDGVVLRKPS